MEAKLQEEKLGRDKSKWKPSVEWKLRKRS